jgi:hypothetical protein
MGIMDKRTRPEVLCGMVQRKKNVQAGRKAGSIIDQPTDPPASKNKAKKPKKPSRGK